MEDARETFTVEISVRGATESYDFGISSDVDFVKKEMRETFCVKGGNLSLDNNRLVSVKGFAAGKTYHFIKFLQGMLIHCFPITSLILPV